MLGNESISMSKLYRNRTRGMVFGVCAGFAEYFGVDATVVRVLVVIGAVVFLLLEEVLSHYTIYWQFALGAALLAVVLAAPNGLMSLLRRKERA